MTAHSLCIYCLLADVYIVVLQNQWPVMLVNRVINAWSVVFAHMLK